MYVEENIIQFHDNFMKQFGQQLLTKDKKVKVSTYKAVRGEREAKRVK